MFSAAAMYVQLTSKSVLFLFILLLLNYSDCLVDRIKVSWVLLSTDFEFISIWFEPSRASSILFSFMSIKEMI